MRPFCYYGKGDEMKENKKGLILASGSPRRRELLGMLGVPFEVIVSDAEEKVTSTDPVKVTEQLSEQKAMAVANLITDGIVIGADTVVAVDGKILGKPSDEEEAQKMLRLLQGHFHMVYTGVTLVKKESGQKKKEVRTFSVGTKVYVSPMTDEEILHYVQSGDCMDKAGAYGIQGIFCRHIEGIEGDYFNVVGLPVHRLYEELKKYEEQD